MKRTRNFPSLVLVFSLIATVIALPLSAREKEAEDVAIKAMYDRLNAIEALLASPATGTVSEENTDTERFDLLAEAGRICHDIQAQTSTAMAEKGFTFFDEALSVNDDPATRAYLGSLHLIEARDAKSILKKIAEVDRGLKEIDRALELLKAQENQTDSVLSSDSIIVRVVRVECSIGLPDMFNRIDHVSEDLNWLLKKWIESPAIFRNTYSPSRLLLLKAQELDLRGNKEFADRYRQKAAELEGGE